MTVNGHKSLQLKTRTKYSNAHTLRLEAKLTLLFLMLALLPYLIVFIDMPITLLNCFRRHSNTILELIYISSPQINILWSRIENNFLICNFSLSVIFLLGSTTHLLSFSLWRSVHFPSPPQPTFFLFHKMIMITIYKPTKLNSFPNINLLLYSIPLSSHAFFCARINWHTLHFDGNKI